MVAELKNDFFQKNLNFSNMEYPSKTIFSGSRDVMIEKLFQERKNGAEIENPIKTTVTLNRRNTFSFDARKNFKVSAQS